LTQVGSLDVQNKKISVRALPTGFAVSLFSSTRARGPRRNGKDENVCFKIEPASGAGWAIRLIGTGQLCYEFV
jgi:hypothetical protein